MDSYRESWAACSKIIDDYNKIEHKDAFETELTREEEEADTEEHEEKLRALKMLLESKYHALNQSLAMFNNMKDHDQTKDKAYEIGIEVHEIRMKLWCLGQKICWVEKQRKEKEAEAKKEGLEEAREKAIQTEADSQFEPTVQ